MAIKILQIDLQNDITPQIGSYDNAGGVTPNNWRNEDGVYSLGPTNGDGRTPYYWFTPTREVTDFDLCWEDYQDHSQTTKQYHLEIGDSAGNVVLSALRQYANYDIGPISIGNLAYRTWHKILVEVRKASASSSTVTIYVDGRKVATGTSNTLLTSAKIALLGHVPNILYMQNAGQRLRYVTIYDRSYASKGINLDGMMTTITTLISKLIAKLSTVAFTGSYNDLSNKPTISTVNDGTLTIQKNGTNVATFTANQSTAATANIEVPTKTSDLTNDSGFITSDDTKIPLAGSNAISGSLIPSTNITVNLGSNSYRFREGYFGNVYATGLLGNPDTGVDINYTIGANLILRGKNRPGEAGIFWLVADNGSSSSRLMGTPSGTLTWGSKNVAMQEDVIPRSGGAVIEGALGRTVNYDQLLLNGGSGWGNGASVLLAGKDYTEESSSLKGCIRLIANDGTTVKTMYLSPDGTWTWDGTACQITSDQRLKQQIAEIDDKLLDAWEDVNLVQFKYNDAVKEKSDNARLHTGYVVQQIDNACKSHGVDVSKYGLYCHEEYPEETEEVEVEQKDGTKVKETRVIREASEHYSLRYTEVYAVECMYLRRCIARLTARIEQLEKEREASK